MSTLNRLSIRPGYSNPVQPEILSRGFTRQFHVLGHVLELAGREGTKSIQSKLCRASGMQAN